MKENNSKKLTTFWACAFFVLLACFIGLGILFLSKTSEPNNQPQPSDTAMKNDSDTSQNMQLSTEAVESGQAKENQGMTYFTGYDSLFIAKDGYIPLTNEGKNDKDIYMLYVIYNEDGAEIYRSDLIAPGMEIQWNAGEILEAGEYSLVFHTQPYKVIDGDKAFDTDNLKPLYYIDQNVSLTIVE